jgi:hypothetical protein
MIKTESKKGKRYPLIGWREWVSLPDLNIPFVKAKVDTGARTSALHAFAFKLFMENGVQRIQFDIHPFQHNTDIVVTSVADVIDKRWVTDSGGHQEERFVIETPMVIRDNCYKIEITLTERENMLFRMLLGRSALSRRFIVNPARSFLTTRAKKA